MKKVSLMIVCLATMLMAGTGLKAQEITITLEPGWNWISYTNSAPMQVGDALGDFVPMEGDIIQAQRNNTQYRGGHWRGGLTQFVPGRGYKYYSSRTASPKDGQQVYEISTEVGYENKKLGGIGRRFIEEMKAAGFTHDMRETTLGHLQRGGVPIAYDRVLSAEFGVKAFEMVLNGQFGQMVSYRHPDIVAVSLKEAVAQPNLVSLDSDLVRTARGLNISLGI